MGDFNIDLLNQSNIPDRWKYIYMSYGLTQIIKQPTRVTETSASLLDHINYVKASQFIKMTLSDHYGIGMRFFNVKIIVGMIPLPIKNKHL